MRGVMRIREMLYIGMCIDQVHHATLLTVLEFHLHIRVKQGKYWQTFINENTLDIHISKFKKKEQTGLLLFMYEYSVVYGYIIVV